MISKKVCMLGAFSVGKTSLVSRFVHSVFSDKYLSTVGVKISKKTLAVDDREVNLILWDMEGKDIYTDINMSHLRGAMGFFVVADATRRETLDVALTLSKLVTDMMGPLPHYLLINKTDLPGEIDGALIDKLAAQEGNVLRTSAKTGLGVQEAFSSLARLML